MAQPLKLPFPILGLNNNEPYSEQPEGTTPDAQNVRGYDPLEQRLRGGCRPGLSKWYANTINDPEAIQDINRVKGVGAIEAADITTLGVGVYATTTNGYFNLHLFTTGAEEGDYRCYGRCYACVRTYDGNWYLGFQGSNDWEGNDGSGADVVMIDSATPTPAVLWHADLPAANVFDLALDAPSNRLICVTSPAANEDDVHILDADTGGSIATTDAAVSGAYATSGVAVDSLGNIYVATTGSTTNSYKSLIKYDSNLNELWSWWSKYDAHSGDYSQMEKVAIHPDDGRVLVVGNVADIWDDTTGGTSTDKKNVWCFDSDGNLLWSYLAGGSVDDADDWCMDCIWLSGEDDKCVIGKLGGDDYEQVMKLDVSDPDSITEDWTYKTEDADNRGCYALSEDEDGNIFAGGSNSTTWTGNDGSSKNIWWLDASDGSLLNTSVWPIRSQGDYRVVALDASAAGTAPPSTTLEEAMTVVSDGTIKTIRSGVLATPTNGDEAMLGGNDNSQNGGEYFVMSQAAFSKVFFVDGLSENYYKMYSDSSEDIVKPWTATAGTLPINPRLIALYRGRLVLAGATDDPHNWFMSKSGDPFDWDYAPSTATAIQAVAGNNSEVGLIGDVITTLIPFSDDVLYVGGDHTIWAITGDPAAGGVIDLVTDKVGMAFGRSWTRDPQNNLYFFSIDGIYRMPVGGAPENITRGRIRKVLQDIDLEQSWVKLEWDAVNQGLFVLVVQKDFSSPAYDMVYYWEQRNNAWWKDVYANNVPTCLFSYDAEDPNDRAFLIGCDDSTIKQFDRTASDDDGETITSYVWFPPVKLDDELNTRLTRTQLIMGDSSAACTLGVYAESSAQEIITASASFTKATAANRNMPMLQRVMAPVLAFKLSSVLPKWAFESLNVTVEPAGMVKRTSRS